MPSFDVVSEVDHHELDNALDQANREVGTRFDFKGADAAYSLQDKSIHLEAQNEFQIKQMLDILYAKIAKRKIDLKSLGTQAEIETRGKRAILVVGILEGIDAESSKKIIKMIKESKLKVQASIQGEQVRITGKNKDDLQEAMALLRGGTIDMPLQFTNFRD